MIRRSLLALALIAGSLGSPAGFLVAPGWAQAPPPVPAEPDTERRTRYTGVSSVTTFPVNFDLYGDGIDYASWLEVWVNGIQIPASGNWTLQLGSGSFTTLSRPISGSNASIVFTAAQSGTVDIVGARRPRRISQLAENRGVTARDFNQLTTDLWMTVRERWDRASRTITAPPGETLSSLPPAATRANGSLGFNASGDLIVNAGALSGATVSAPMVPVVQAASLAAARSALGADNASNLLSGVLAPSLLSAGVNSNALSTKTGDYTIATSDCGKTIAGSGGPWTLALPAVSGFPLACVVQACNTDANDASHHAIRLSGWPSPSFSRLWMGQCQEASIVNGAWKITKWPGKWLPTFTPTLYVDNAGNNANDGLISAVSSTALATIQACWDIFTQEWDLRQRQPICAPSGGQTFNGGLVCTSSATTSVYILQANGGSPATIQNSSGNVVITLNDFCGYLIIDKMKVDCTSAASHPCYGLYMHQQNGADLSTGAPFNNGVTFIGASASDYGVWCDSMCKINTGAVLTFSGSFYDGIWLDYGSVMVVNNGLTLAPSASIANTLVLATKGSSFTMSNTLTQTGAGAVNQYFTANNMGSVLLASNFAVTGSAGGTPRQWAILNNSLFCNASATAVPGSAGISTGTGSSAGTIAAATSGACTP